MEIGNIAGALMLPKKCDLVRVKETVKAISPNFSNGTSCCQQ
jgi:hypothetical protein